MGKINKEINITTKFYILNEDWEKEFKSIFYYDEIMTEEVKNLIKNNNYKEIYNPIINKIPEKIINNLKNLPKTRKFKKLNDQNNYKINTYNEEWQNNNITLFTSNYVIINKDIKKFLKEINNKPKQKNQSKSQELQEINCLFSDNKMIITFKSIAKEKEKTINIGYYENYLFITEKIIIAKKTNIDEIFNIFKNRGYNSYIKYLLFTRSIYKKIKETNIKIFKISNNNISSNLIISKILMALICVSIFNHNINEQTKMINNNKLEEVYLLNPIWLNENGYKKVKEIINKNINNKYILNKEYKDILFSDFILSLEEEDIISLGDINRGSNENKFNMDNIFVNFESLIIPNNKSIYYYNNFIPINKNIFKLYFNFNKKNIETSYIKFFSGNNKNIALIENNEQYSFLIGSILNNTNIFKLEYVFYFNSKSSISNNIEHILTDPNKYINKHYNEKNDNNDILPIYNEDNYTIGYIYKYKENNFNNNKIINYDNALKNEDNNMKLQSNNILNDDSMPNNNNFNPSFNNLINNNDIQNNNIIEPYNNLMNNNIPKNIDFNNNINNIINNNNFGDNIIQNNNILNMPYNNLMNNYGVVKNNDSNILNNNFNNNILQNINNQNIQNINMMNNNFVNNTNNNLNIVDNSKNINYLNQNNENNLLIKEINDVKQQFNNEKNKNKKLSEEIESIKNKLNEEKIKNINIEKNSSDLKAELEKERQKNKELEDKLNKQIENINLIKNDSQESILKTLINKDNEITELKNKLSRYPFELNEGEKLICINFKTTDQKLDYSLICKDTDLFCNIEKELYDHNNEYFETENYFNVNGIRIDKLKSLKDNGIKNNDIIILNKLEI